MELFFFAVLSPEEVYEQLGCHNTDTLSDYKFYLYNVLRILRITEQKVVEFYILGIS